MIVADYVIDFLVKRGITDIFLVSGGGIMYLLDAIYRNKKITYISNYHEQASATCAESYARLKNRIGACLVTTGPGSTNAITGVAAAWVDSISMLVISGQVKREVIADYSKLRQMGNQEVNIIPMVKPITKYAVTIMNPESIKFELEKGFHEATTNRPGPVWLNIPLDVQGSNIDEAKLKSFNIPKYKSKNNKIKKVGKVISLLKLSKRPVFILGHGIRLSGASETINKLLDEFDIPILLTLNGLDLIPFSHPKLIGYFGPSGYRRANLVLQNADLIISIGASLNIASTGFNYSNFARKGKIVMVNIDKGELQKKTINVDMSIKMDGKDFIEAFIKQSSNVKLHLDPLWLTTGKLWKEKYPTIISKFKQDKKHVNSYLFMDKLSDLLTKEDILTTGMGLDVISFNQAFKIKEGQRAYVNKNFGQMGWCLPAAIGACIANNRKRSICVTGDGSIQFNLQELNTIRYYKLPIKIFVFNNKGYKSIRDTQNSLFEGRLVGADKNSGVINPNFKKLASAYDLQYDYISNNSQIEKKIRRALITKGPTLYEVNISYDQSRMPRSVTRRKLDGSLESGSLEDMWPHLPKEELEAIMKTFS
ncbi:hypothetical protein A3C23_00855 [Candidatus Roizmanbacteria bacterium RIFCSPHIGHO2_02_FULL_37_13b]|uniref:Acetolactate synthase n=1 Tax=Candidatus Roizmanbacteria bacterium RIFCSPLOWO2_02_FULL_36_11 TaxID=1802071 RepID=A0A1F7JIZ8_9BACT|nr:MAG: hypothetical protein A3C23_00855 [Candidatus Roizmanbacteria bacterium RIFCSPHIGHO2_02_FULL_37_13b]OGK55556.1 MAG: hypothetical protein A3H78_05330 [Candidatus Roizmanbacteria bacterium RIFCSPLOWO2_02_FULL_36_11]